MSNEALSRIPANFGYQFPLYKGYFFQGWNSIGVASNPQPNAGMPNGAFYSTISMDYKNQSRSSSDIGHYREVISKRPNYHLLPNNLVTKILFDQERAEPTAVEVRHTSWIKERMIA